MAAPSIVFTIVWFILTSCGPVSGEQQFTREVVVTPSLSTTKNPPQMPTASVTASPVPTESPPFLEEPGSWTNQPILPTLSERALEIFERGLTFGNNPRAFSKVGDGGIASHWFLTVFDSAPGYYNLGPQAGLSATIEYFSGSFARESLAARAGFNTSRILDPLFAMNDICLVEESPLTCELRLHHPSFALISLGTNQVWTPDLFQQELEQIVVICIQQGVVPILATKGDNLEGDQRINAIIADTARKYQIPLWNFWLAIQSLPDQGLQADGEHLTWAENDFSDPEAMTHAWPVRNLSALQLLTNLIEQLPNQ